MRLTPDDIASFAYCPYLYKQEGIRKTVPALTLFENMVRLSILAAEHKVMVQEGFLNARKIGNAWERLWWPAATKAGLSPQETDKRAIKAALKFSSYCQYDIASPSYEAIGTDIRSEISLPHGVLAASIDLIKVSIHKKADVVLIDFHRQGLTRTQVSNDLGILSIIYAFAGLKRPLTYISVDLSESLREIKTVASAFDLQDIEQIGKNINYISEGIYKKIDYQSAWTCENCGKCRRT